MKKEDELLEIVNQALDKLYTNERYLFESDSSERNMVFHFARYFIEISNKHDNLKYYDIDCEYNRNRLDIKKYRSSICDGKEYRIFPDFVFHKRGCSDYNLLAIEFKKNKKRDDNDIEKLKFLTNRSYEYGYQLGLFISLGKNRESVKIIKITNGEELTIQ